MAMARLKMLNLENPGTGDATSWEYQLGIFQPAKLEGCPKNDGPLGSRKLLPTETIDRLLVTWQP